MHISTLMDSQKGVTPVKTGVQKFCNQLKKLDSGFRRHDKKWCFLTFSEIINLESKVFSRKSKQGGAVMKHVALVVGILCCLFFAVNSCDRGEQPTESISEEPTVGVEEPKGAMEAVEEEAEEAVEAVEEKAEEAVEEAAEEVKEEAEGVVAAPEEKAEEAVEAVE